MASDGNSALEKLDSESYDVLIFDQKMPGPTGVELFEKAKKYILILYGY